MQDLTLMWFLFLLIMAVQVVKTFIAYLREEGSRKFLQIFLETLAVFCAFFSVKYGFIGIIFIFLIPIIFKYWKK